MGRACLFLPDSEDELRQAINLIDRALASERAKPGWLLPYFRFAKALAEYRAARLEIALTLLDADTQQVLVPAPRRLLAMVQHRLGKADAARASVCAAVATYVWDVKSATDREAWMFHLLRREAETVLNYATSGMPGWSAGRGPGAGQKNLRSLSAIETSLMLASRRRIKPSSSNSHSSLP